MPRLVKIVPDKSPGTSSIRIEGSTVVVEEQRPGEATTVSMCEVCATPELGWQAYYRCIAKFLEDGYFLDVPAPVRTDISSLPERDPFRLWLNAIQQPLNERSGEPASYGDFSTVVASNRQALRGMLERFLPSTLQIGTGYILDSTGVRSRQQDLVVARADAPAFRLDDGVTGYVSDSVLAVVEARPFSYRDKTREAMENIRALNQLTAVVSIRRKGPTLFEEAFAWLESKGGLYAIEARLLSPARDGMLACPEDIWAVMTFVRYWLHWARGDFGRPDAMFRSFPELFDSPDFPLFVTLLQQYLRASSRPALLCGPESAEWVRSKGFFGSLFEAVMQENRAPATFLLGYQGTPTLIAFVEQMRALFAEGLTEGTRWYTMPKIIMNQHYLMYRSYNQYHCCESAYPTLFLASVLSQWTSRNLSCCAPSAARVCFGSHFDLLRAFSVNHPRHEPSYILWDIPLDSSGPGEIQGAPRSRSGQFYRAAG